VHRCPAIGGPCTSICANDVFCDNGVCAAKRTSGPCNLINAACADVAYCDPATQQCVLRKMTGETRTTFDECPEGDVCHGTCRPDVAVTPEALSRRILTCTDAVDAADQPP
jgi:hypothetical protein